MSEPINLKYDPDDFDPIVVKEYKSIWSLVVPLGLITIATYFFFTEAIFSPYSRAMQPGNWIGKVSMFTGLYQFAFIIFSVPIAVGYALIARRYKLGIGLALWCALLVWIGSVLPPTSPELRYTAELPSYQQAILSDKPFGDQYSEESDGRKLIYWRWVQHHLDNACGVIYDPEDRLTNEQRGDSYAGDAMSFRHQTGGTLSQFTKIKPHWYYVEHS